MSFSASPLIPTQRESVEETWRMAAQAVLTAVTEAMPQIPSAEALFPDAPLAEPAAATLPSTVGAAVVAEITGSVEGRVLVVVGQELVDALSGTPFGDLEISQALKPVLETMAERLGARLGSEPELVAPDTCLTKLDGATVVLVPLLAGAEPSALIGVSLSALGQDSPAATPAARPADAGGAVGDGSDTARRSTWGIDMLRDVEMEVTCELGRTRMTVRQLLALSPGDVVELDRLAGSPADLLVNGTLLARGEVVVVDESFGLRITEIVSRDVS
jgi:flagellar motor switch protein FliN/FliY